MMHQMGFCEEWITLIIRCITSVKYTLVTKGKNREEFQPARGLRQGDPLSPYLFLIYAESFSRLLDKMKREEKILGTRVGRSNISITHLFFADDCMLFGEVSTDGANHMKAIINKYEAISGQKGWKIITQPDCLLARVMKAKYFPKGDCMSARVGSYLSYTWRSIWGARCLLKEGIGWRIGNGQSVNIWNDAWLPGVENGRVQCQQINIRYSMVSDLIDRDAVTWKHEEIRSLFGEEQMQRIVAIPLANIGLQDALVWRGDNTGIYTAKKGYKWRNIIETPNIHQNSLTKFYKRFWDIKVPSKIRMHLWRVAKKYMPFLFNLKIHRLVNNTLCPVCQRNPFIIFCSDL
ncbi:hypothetical protein CXB51_024907 [Gossypium anomalum]|uniref:Reverse transcriptase domain-containing protein n=1 Tax=Gossypium anomalum TaxID=47600 RepID=A0A8J5YPS1_9ROSI|nr:hypothetical protein CXB51_024907 [Gossypium anomalum]